MPTSPRTLIPYPAEDTPKWYDQFEQMVNAIDASLYAEREDRNFILMGGGTMTFTAATGVLTWSGDIIILSPVTAYQIRILGPGTVTLLDGQLFYITVTRNPLTNQVVSPVVDSRVPNAVRGDDQVLIGYRSGTVVHFREGFVIGDGENQNIFDSNTAISWTAAGDLSGTHSSQTVVGLRGRPLSAVAPVLGQALVWDGAAWTPTNTGAVTWAGDLVGSTNSNQVVSGLTGTAGRTFIRNTSSNLGWVHDATNPTLFQDDSLGVAQDLIVRAQNAGGAANAGGNLLLKGGVPTGGAAAGDIRLFNASTEVARVSGTTQLNALKFGVGTVGGTPPTITKGVGVPVAAEPNGSIYLRTDGTDGLTGIYTRQGGAWYVPGPPSTLAGDVTGPIGSNVVEKLTGAAGIVKAIGAIQLDAAAGTFPSTGLIRTKDYGAGTHVMWSGYSAGANAALLSQVSATGFDFGSSQWDSVQLRGGTTANVLVSSGAGMYVAATNTTYSVNTGHAFFWTDVAGNLWSLWDYTNGWQFYKSTPAAWFYQAPTADVAPKNFIFTTQAPFAGAATNLTSGDFVIDVPASVGGGNKLGGFNIRYNNTSNVRIGSYANGSYGAIWFIDGDIPSAINYSFLGSSGGVSSYFNAATEHIYVIGGVNYLGRLTLNKWSFGAGGYLTYMYELDASATAKFHFTDNATSAAIVYDDRATDALPKELTLQAQGPYSLATGANRVAADAVVNIQPSVGGGVKYGGLSVRYNGGRAVDLGVWANSGTYALYFGATPSATSFALLGDGTNTVINAPGNTGFVDVRVNSSTYVHTTTASTVFENAGSAVLTIDTGATTGATYAPSVNAFWSLRPWTSDLTAKAALYLGGNGFVVAAGNYSFLGDGTNVWFNSPGAGAMNFYNQNTTQLAQADTTSWRFYTGNVAGNGPQVEAAHGHIVAGGTGGTEWKTHIGPYPGFETADSAIWFLAPGTARTSANMAMYGNGTNTIINIPVAAQFAGIFGGGDGFYHFQVDTTSTRFMRSGPYTSAYIEHTGRGHVVAGGGNGDFKVHIGPLAGFETTFGGIWMLAAATGRGSSNCSFYSDGSSIYFNIPVTGNTLNFTDAGATFIAQASTSVWRHYTNITITQGLAAPKFYQEQSTVNVNGETLLIHAQDAKAGGGGNGGMLQVRGGAKDGVGLTGGVYVNDWMQVGDGASAFATAGNIRGDKLFSIQYKSYDGVNTRNLISVDGGDNTSVGNSSLGSLLLSGAASVQVYSGNFYTFSSLGYQYHYVGFAAGTGVVQWGAYAGAELYRKWSMNLAFVDAFDKSCTSVTIKQDTPTTDVATVGMTIQAQSAYASATGSNRNAGALTLKGGTAASGGVDGPVNIGSALATIVATGAHRFTTRLVNSNITIDTTTTDMILRVDTSAARTVTLPAPTDGRLIILKDITGSAATNNITLARNGSEKIEGTAASYTFNTNFSWALVFSDGTDWFVLR